MQDVGFILIVGAHESIINSIQFVLGFTCIICGWLFLLSFVVNLNVAYTIDVYSASWFLLFDLFMPDILVH